MPQCLRTCNSRGVLALIAAGGVLLRLALLVLLPHDLRGDALHNHNIAVNLLEGHGFSHSPAAPWYPDALRSPLQVLLLACCYLCFGRSNLPYLVLQIGLDLAAAWLWHRRMERLAGAKVAAVGTALFLIAPYEAAFSTLLLTETLTVFLTVAWMDRTLEAAEHPGVASFVLTSVLGALIVLTRPALLVMVLCGAAWLVARTRAWKPSLMAVAVGALILSPWVYRNAVVFGRPTASAAASLGVSMYLGVTTDGNVWLTHEGDATLRDDLRQWSTRSDLPPSQAVQDDDALRHVAWQAIQQHPQAWCAHVAAQAWALLWQPVDAIQDTAADLPSWLTDFAFQVSCAMQRLLVLLALIGAWRARDRLRMMTLPLLAAAVVVVSYALIHVEPRFVLSLEPLLALLAGLALATPLPQVETPPPASPRLMRGALYATVAIAAMLLFFNLGGSGLWVDEATCALFAEGVWQTGDTTAVVGHNLIAYRGGAELKDLKDRYTPPLQYYVTAPMIGLCGNSPAAARFADALLGFVVVLVLARWVLQSGWDAATLLLACAALIGNVPFWMFMRECRYHAAATAALTLLVWRWSQHRGGWTDTLLCSLFGVLLMAAHYPIYAAAAVALGVDHLLWHRHRLHLPRTHWACLVGSQAVAAAALLSVWNPLAFPHQQDLIGNPNAAAAPAPNWFLLKTIFFWRAWRDLNGCEMACLGILLLGAWLALSDLPLRRVMSATVLAVLVVTLVTPTAVLGTDFAEVRWVMPVILPACFVTARALARMMRYRVGFALAASVMLGLTNLPYVFSNLAPLYAVPLRSTLSDYLQELGRPRLTPEDAATGWLAQHALADKTVWVQPADDAYPMMFRAPQFIYAWQLPAPAGQFQRLNPALFKGVVPPDYVVVFGPSVTQFRALLQDWAKISLHYQEAARLNIFWEPMTRAELLWHSFRPLPVGDAETQGVYIFQRI